MADRETLKELQTYKLYMNIIKLNTNLKHQISDLSDSYEMNDGKLTPFQKIKAKYYLYQAKKYAAKYNDYKKNVASNQNKLVGSNDPKNEVLQSEIKKDKKLLQQAFEYRDHTENIDTYIKYNKETLEKMLNIKKESEQISDNKTAESKKASFPQ